MHVVSSNRKRRSIADRMRVLYFVVPALIITIILALGLFISRNIADDAALRLARQYSIESAANFQVFATSHMRIMYHVSESNRIARWLANEEDEEAKALAFDAIMRHVIASPDSYFMFTVYETLQGYNFDADMSLEEFVSWGQLAGGEVSQWFFDTRDAKLPFILNIQRTRPDEYGNWELYIWSNHRVYYEGRFVGVFTLGSPFDAIFNAAFGGFEEDYRRGYVLDRNGMVRLDSAGILETEVDGLPVHFEVPETYGNPDLVRGIADHLQYIQDGMFRIGTPTNEAVSLSHDIYRYASISPIVGTDWSVMVLSTRNSGIDAQYMPVLALTMIMLISFVLFGGMAVRRIVITPLNRLAQSTAEIGIDFDADIYGTERDDEIGYIAQTIKKSQKVLNTINRAAKILLTSDSDEAIAAAQSLEIIGRSANVDRIHIWKNEMIDGELYFVLQYNWLRNKDVEKIIGDLGMRFPYSERPDWLDTLNRGEKINAIVSQLHPLNAAFMTEHGVKSFATVPLFINNELFGSISVSDCTNERIFTNEEMEMLASVGLMFINILLRNEQIAAMNKAAVAEESNRAKTNFLARMSHEIRTPITAVMGISEIELQNPNMESQTEESFAKIRTSANLLLGIVNDILDISKIEAGKMTIMQADYDVAGMISNITRLPLYILGSKNIDFSLHVDEQIPAYLLGDMLRIEQVVNNLLSNALKYTTSGSVELSWRCCIHDEKDGYANLVISVIDTGLGMTKEQLKVLKESEYTRFHEDDSKTISGTGLGMPIVFSFLKLMDGDIKIDSEVGKGTKVVVSIPQKLSSKTGVIGKDAAERLQKFDESMHHIEREFTIVPDPMPYGKVLVVDDVEPNLFVIRGLLAFYDLNIESCHNGHEAIEKIKQGNIYDIIFMDHMMPGINGTDAMHTMRDMGYTHPIVVLTANALRGQAEEYIKSGFDGYMSKPIQTSQLNKILIKHIRDKQTPEVIEAARLSRIEKEAEAELDINNYQTNGALLEKLRADFAGQYVNLPTTISEAVSTNDIKTAHLLAHSLKSSAGLIQELSLAQIAENLEQKLSKGEIPTARELSVLGDELNRVLESIAAPKSSLSLGGMVATEVADILNQLEPLLQSHNVESLRIIEKLKAMPISAILARQVEDFEFVTAMDSLRTLRKVLRV